MSKKKRLSVPENYAPEPAEQREWSTPEEVAELLALEAKHAAKVARLGLQDAA